MHPASEPAAASPVSAPATPRRALSLDQQAAADRAARHLKRPGSRGHIVSACGTGKTLTALRTAEVLDVRYLLVVVQGLDLIGQWAAAARADGRREPLMAVSSSDARKHPVLAGAGAVSTGSGEYLAYWLAQRRKRHEKAIVFVTLDSLPRIEESQHSVFTAPVFDLLVVDEAHRTAGSWDKQWTKIHDNQRVCRRAAGGSPRPPPPGWARAEPGSRCLG